MISKLITHGSTRDAALQKMRDALDSYVIHGLNHNVPFLRTVCDHPRFMTGEVDTKFIEEEYPKGFSMEHIKISDNDINHLLTTAASTYYKLRDDLNVNTNDNVIICEMDGHGPEKGTNYRFEITVTPQNDNDNNKDNNNFNITVKSLDNNSNTTVSLSNEYSLGDYVFQTNMDGNDSVICQLISKSSHDMTLQYKGLKVCVCVCVF